MQRSFALPLSILGIALLLAAGCDGEFSAASARPALAAAAPPVVLMAAASTAGAAEEIAARFTRETGIDVRVTAAGSNALATQILAGVPGAVFLSANPRWAAAVDRAGLAVSVHPLLGNRLVLVVPSGNPAGIARPADLLSPRVARVALAGEAVPAGIYAEQALRRAGVFDALARGRRIARGQDVRFTLTYVERGEAAAGVVYATDARAAADVEVVYAFPADTHDPIVYPVVLLRTPERERDAARRLFEYLRGDRARGVFEEHGFAPLAAAPAR